MTNHSSTARFGFLVLSFIRHFTDIH
jgi:hypothetical protein